MRKLPIFETKLAPRRSKEERKQKRRLNIKRNIEKYIKDGCEGDLIIEYGYLDETYDLTGLTQVGGDLILINAFVKLPDNLYINGNARLSYFFYPHEEIKMEILIGATIDGDLELESDFVVFDISKVREIGENLIIDGCIRKPPIYNKSSVMGEIIDFPK